VLYVGPVDGVGDGSRRYTSDPIDGVRPGRYTSGHNAGSKLVRRPRAVPNSTASRDEQLRDGVQDGFDGAAIVGDPMSSTRIQDRLQRASQLLERL